MKLTAVLAAFLVLPAVAAVAQQDRRNFWALNNTGKEISRFYVSPHTTTDWEEDVLGSDTLPYRLGVMIVFHGARSTCFYDFKIVFADGSYQIYNQGRDLCSNVAVHFDSNTSRGLN